MSDTFGDRLRAVRKVLGMTQADVAEKSDGLLRQETVAKVERGVNKASSIMVQRGLATAFGVSEPSMRGFISGGLSTERFVEFVLAEESRRIERERDANWERELGTHVPPKIPAHPLENAILHAVDPDIHTFDDVDFVRESLGQVWDIMTGAVTETKPLIRAWLDACAELRGQGKPVTPLNVLAVVSLHAFPDPDEHEAPHLPG